MQKLMLGTDVFCRVRMKNTSITEGQRGKSKPMLIGITRPAGS